MIGQLICPTQATSSTDGNVQIHQLVRPINMWYLKFQGMYVKQKAQTMLGQLQFIPNRRYIRFLLAGIKILNIQIGMEVDINEPNSKFFNVFLRMLQLSGQIALAYWAVRSHEYHAQSCDLLLITIASYLAYFLFFLNLAGIITIRCSNRFPRCVCFVLYLLDLLICAAFIAQYFILKGNSKITQCAATRAFSEFSALSAAIFAVLSLVILIAPLGWAQRYTNSPGTIAWVPLMLGYTWSSKLSLPMLIVGIAQAVISGLSLLVNLVTCSGPTTKTKKASIAVWIICLLIMMGCQVYAVLTYMKLGTLSEFKDILGKKFVAIFIVVSIWDIFFWLWGFKTLSYENGDPVRGEIFEPEYQMNEEVNQPIENSQNHPQRGTYQSRAAENQQNRATYNNVKAVGEKEYGTIRY